MPPEPKPHECQRCGKIDPTDVARRHQNTRYVNEESNYATFCSDCQKEVDEYWDELWAEYYTGRL